MGWFGKYLKSSIGAKHVMAVTGLMLVGFILAHMAGNLQVFLGAKALNDYAYKLQSLGPVLWIMRIGLIFIFLLHVSSAMRLVMMNRAARPVKYKMVHTEKSTFASRAMAMSGLIVLAFLVFHLMQFTFGGGPFPEDFNQIDKLTGLTDRHHVYNMVVAGFSRIPVGISYIVAISLLSLHLSHGISSIFQSLGLNHSKYNKLIKMAGPSVALLVLVGNCSMPIACMAGWLKVVS